MQACVSPFSPKYAHYSFKAMARCVETALWPLCENSYEIIKTTQYFSMLDSNEETILTTKTPAASNYCQNMSKLTSANQCHLSEFTFPSPKFTSIHCQCQTLRLYLLHLQEMSL